MAGQHCVDVSLAKPCTHHLSAERSNQQTETGQLSTPLIYNQLSTTAGHEDLNSNFSFLTSNLKTDKMISMNVSNLPSKSLCKNLFRNKNNSQPKSNNGQINPETINHMPSMKANTTNSQRKKISWPPKSNSSKNLRQGINDISSSSIIGKIFSGRTKDTSFPSKSGKIFPQSTSASIPTSSPSIIFPIKSSSPLPTSSNLKTFSKGSDEQLTDSATSKNILENVSGSLHSSTDKTTSAKINTLLTTTSATNNVSPSGLNDSFATPTDNIVLAEINGSNAISTINNIASAEISGSLPLSNINKIAAKEINGLNSKDKNEIINNLSVTMTTDNITSEFNNLSATMTTNNTTSEEVDNLQFTSTGNINIAKTNILHMTSKTDKINAKNFETQITSLNFNSWSTPPQNLSQNTLHHSPHMKTDDVEQTPYFQSLPTIYAEDASAIPNITGKSKFHRKDSADYIHSFKPNQRKKSGSFSSPSSFRHNFQHGSYYQNVRRKDIVFGEVIGNGGFGKVYKGMIHSRPVAIKVVQKRRGSGIHREILQAERLAFSLNLRHENIVNILALNLCDGLRGDALIVMELASPLTLQSILDDHSKPVTQSQRLQFALQISEALNYLHANEVAHLDVKPRNVLLTSDHTCKLADFGSLTRTRTDGPREETEYTQLLGTLPYRAPELMKGSFPSNKADIFSLGITFWQMVTREVPHGGANPHWLIYQVTKNNKRPDHHDAGSDIIEVKYRDLYTSCWNSDPLSRPDASVVIISLIPLFRRAHDRSWTDDINRND